MSEYAERDIEAQGDQYYKHVSAMTGENLHSKSDVAAELAHRDIRIQTLEADLAKTVECLEFYADDTSYESGQKLYSFKILDDAGRKAQTTLNDIRKG